MKIVKIVSFICVLALAMSLCSMFSFAAAPEAEVEVESSEIMPRAKLYIVVEPRTYMYNTHSLQSGYVYPDPIPVGKYVTHKFDWGTLMECSATWSGATRTGCVLRSHLDPV